MTSTEVARMADKWMPGRLQVDGSIYRLAGVVDETHGDVPEVVAVEELLSDEALAAAWDAQNNVSASEFNQDGGIGAALRAAIHVASTGGEDG